MAFVNIRLTTEQREEFVKKNISNPISPVLPPLNPALWTIDKDKDVYLFKIGTHRDYPYDVLFYYSWKDCDMILPLKRKYVSPYICAWDLKTEWKQPINNIKDRAIQCEMINDLKLALTEHRLEGNPDIKEDTNINFEF